MHHGRSSFLLCCLSWLSSPATRCSRGKSQRYTRQSFLFSPVRLSSSPISTPFSVANNRVSPGMTVGLILRVTGGDSIRDIISFDYQIFFNVLLPPIILSSGYELHQANFFRNIGTILTFAFAGTFISAVVIAVLLWLYTRIPLEGLDVSWIDALSVGATLSATDPVTILAIFNSFKVDPKLYTIIFGESILNDAVAIVIFESTQRSGKGEAVGLWWSLFRGVWYFLSEFFGSLIIGCLVGVATALGLKYTYVRRYPKMESCLVVLIAYATYFFSQAVEMSGKSSVGQQCTIVDRLTSEQVSYPCCSAESHSNTTPTSICRGGPSLRPSIFSRCLLNSRRTSFLYTSACPYSPKRTSCISRSLSSSRCYRSAWHGGWRYSHSRG